MSNSRPGKLTLSSPAKIIRKLALAADRALWAGDQNECIAIIARAYDLADGIAGLEDSSSCVAALDCGYIEAFTAEHLGHNARYINVILGEQNTLAEVSPNSDLFSLKHERCSRTPH